MKKLAIIAAVGLMTSTAFAQKVQEKDVPANAKNTLLKAYPNAKEVKWDKEGNNYEAGFDLNKVDYSVLFDEQGNITETEIEIGLNELPQKAKDYIAQNYKGLSTKEAAKITDAKGTITFEAELKGKDLIFDTEGNFLKEIKN